MLSSRPVSGEERTSVTSPEERLVLAARERDEAAWSTIFDENFQALYRYAYYRTGDEAASEELAAQVFEEALRGIKRFEYRGISIKAWLFTIARNVVANHLSREARLRQASLSETISSPAEVGSSLERDEILMALRALSEEQQQVVGLTLLEDVSVRDCARIMGMAVREVNALQLEALRQLRMTLSQEQMS
jgi:RNA polymerase sigma-70 factor (ECF subfamily)